MKNIKRIRCRLILSLLLLGILTPLLLSVVHVKAQTSYIEVYAYDAFKLDPIDGAEFALFDDAWMHIVTGFADGSGFYNFTGLDAGNYYVEFYASGYPNNQTSVAISFDGEGETITFLAEPNFNPGDGYIGFYVYDSLTMDPVTGVYIELSSNGYDIENNFTDVLGFYNFTGLGVGVYEITVIDSDYRPASQNVFIDYDGEGESSVLYIDPLYTPGIGFIEVDVYGLDTLAPIAFADAILFNDLMQIITMDIADASGFYNFTDLGPGSYYIYSSAAGYETNFTEVTIDYDGEGEYLVLYLSPEPTHGNGYIEVFVYDQITLLPLENVDIVVYTQYYIPISGGMTDAIGLCNITDLGVDTYIIEAYLTRYENNETIATIDFDGEGEYVEIYLSPVMRSIEILSPTESETVEGGSVLVKFSTSESNEVSSFDVYVNDEFITEISTYGTFIYQFIVPIFLNGTNTIKLVAFWNDASTANDSVTFNSINVIPIVNINEGDFCNYRVDLIGSGSDYIIWNFTFVEWVSPFIMKTLVYLARYDEYGLDDEEIYFIEVNVLNGYVPDDSTYQFHQLHLLPLCTLLPIAQIGDIAVTVLWEDLVNVTGSITWDHTDVWVLEGYSGRPYVMYSEINTNIIHYVSAPDDFEIFLVETSIDFTDPSISDELDFGYFEGTTGNSITWDVSDTNPSHYIIYRDSSEIDSGDFYSGVIRINVDGLVEGTYTYLIVIYDLAGNHVEDTVIVTVLPTASEFSSLILLLPISTLIVVCYVLVFKRKTKN